MNVSVHVNVGPDEVVVVQHNSAPDKLFHVPRPDDDEHEEAEEGNASESDESEEPMVRDMSYALPPQTPPAGNPVSRMSSIRSTRSARMHFAWDEGVESLPPKMLSRVRFADQHEEEDSGSAQLGEEATRDQNTHPELPATLPVPQKNTFVHFGSEITMGAPLFVHYKTYPLSAREARLLALAGGMERQSSGALEPDVQAELSASEWQPSCSRVYSWMTATPGDDAIGMLPTMSGSSRPSDSFCFSTVETLRGAAVASGADMDRSSLPRAAFQRPCSWTSATPMSPQRTMSSLGSGGVGTTQAAGENRFGFGRQASPPDVEPPPADNASPLSTASSGSWCSADSPLSDVGDADDVDAICYLTRGDALDRRCVQAPAELAGEGQLALSSVLWCARAGLPSLGARTCARGCCVPCLMQTKYFSGKALEPCKFGVLCNRCHVRHSQEAMQAVQKQMRAMRKQKRATGAATSGGA